MKLILGTVQFGLSYGINNSHGKPTNEAVKSILDFAFENGIRILDTAEAYGDSQEVIGSYHAKSTNRFEIITKYSAKRSDLPTSLIERVKKDLQILHVDSLYSYMFHSFQDFKQNIKLFRNEVRELKEKGLIKKLGVSAYTNSEIEELLEYQDVDLIQLPFNLLDNYSQRSSVIQEIKNKNIEVHTRSAFLQGLFFKDTNKLTSNLISLKPYLEHLNFVASANDLNLTELSLAYVTQQETIDKVLIGVDSVDQLKNNLASLKATLSKKVMEEIDSIDVKENELLNPSNWKL